MASDSSSSSNSSNYLSRSLQPSGTGPSRSFEYPEVVVLIITSFLVAWRFDFSALSLVQVGLICIPCLFILLSRHRYQKTEFGTILIVVLLSMMVGVLQFNLVFSLAMVLLIAMRIIESERAQRVQLMILSIISMLLFYMFTMLLKGHALAAGEYIVPVLVLFMSVVVVIWKYWLTAEDLSDYSEEAQTSKGRVTTMVKVNNQLSRFMPMQVWQPIVKNNKPVQIENKRAKLTVMFCDIAGFTELSDTLSADNLADILNTYMERMTKIANRHGAVLDKFVGDGMICFFGQPTSKGVREDALACVAMAIDMRREMRLLRQKWRLMGFEGLFIRVGIATGYCHVGNFGSESRMSYTVVGREVNLASRLEAAAPKGEILISQATYDYICHEYACEMEGLFQLKGFENSVRGWRVLDPETANKQVSEWVDYSLPGFNLHLNFKDIKNYDFHAIKEHLNQALERVEVEEEGIKKSK